MGQSRETCQYRIGRKRLVGDVGQESISEVLTTDLLFRKKSYWLLIDFDCDKREPERQKLPCQKNNHRDTPCHSSRSLKEAELDPRYRIKHASLPWFWLKTCERQSTASNKDTKTAHINLGTFQPFIYIVALRATDSNKVPSFWCFSIQVPTNDYYFLPPILTIILIYEFDRKESFMVHYFTDVWLRIKYC